MGVKNPKKLKEIFKNFVKEKADKTEKGRTPPLTESRNDDNIKKIGASHIFIDFSHLLFSKIIVSDYQKRQGDTCDTWDELAKKVNNSVYKLVESSETCENLFLGIDNPETVPRNKAQTQAKRDSATTKKQENGTKKSNGLKTETPLEILPEEKQMITVGKGHIVPTNLERSWKDDDFKTEMLKDRILRHKINTWLACSVIDYIEDNLSGRELKIIAESIQSRTFLEYYQKPLTRLILESERTVFSRLIVTITYSEKLKKNESSKEQVVPSNVSEGELLCFREINKLGLDKIRKVLLVGPDTDLFAIYFLVAPDFIKTEINDFGKKVYLVDNSEIWDLSLLYYTIWKEFVDKKELYQIRSPTDILAFIIIMAGNDFNENIGYYPITRLWDYFFEGKGYEHWQWSYSDALKDNSDFMINQYGSNNSFPSPERKENHAFRITQRVGQPMLNIRVTIVAQNFRSFISDMISPFEIPEEDLTCFFNRCRWTFYYWLFTPRQSEFTPEDPEKYSWRYEKNPFNNKYILMREREIGNVIGTNYPKNPDKETNPLFRRKKKIKIEAEEGED